MIFPKEIYANNYEIHRCSRLRNCYYISNRNICTQCILHSSSWCNLDKIYELNNADPHCSNNAYANSMQDVPDRKLQNKVVNWRLWFQDESERRSYKTTQSLHLVRHITLHYTGLDCTHRFKLITPMSLYW